MDKKLLHFFPYTVYNKKNEIFAKFVRRKPLISNLILQNYFQRTLFIENCSQTYQRTVLRFSGSAF